MPDAPAGAVKIVLAYSGGVDSVYLKWRLESEGHTVVPVTFSVPDLAIGQVAMNRRDRCYWCKRAMAAALNARAAAEGAEAVMDGTNADDLAERRPGLRAMREAGVRSPLAEAGYTKAEVRRRARAAGLAVFARPSSPCLSTRFPYDFPLTPALLERAAAAEAAVRARLSPTDDLRVRCEGDGARTARIEVSPAAIGGLRRNFAAVEHELRALGFTAVTLDPRGFRSGSYDESPAAWR